MVVMLRKFCCCCPLKTGTIIIGVLNVIAGLASLFQGIIAASVGVSIDAQYKHAIVAVGAICLIVGALKDNPELLTPWMVYTVVILIVDTVLYIVMAAEYFKMRWPYPYHGYLADTLFYTLLQFYFLVVVYSLYRDLKGPHNKQTTQQHRRGQQLGRMLPNTRN